jgi:hypothetical protein
LLNQLGQGSQLLGIDKVELVDKIDEMLETGVQVSLRRQKHDVLEMRVVDMRIDTEQALEDNLNDVQEIFREGHTQGTRENFLIIQLVLNPGHQEVNVFLG